MLHSQSLFAVALTLLQASNAVPTHSVLRQRSNDLPKRWEVKSLEARSAPAELAVTDQVVELVPVGKQAPSSQSLQRAIAAANGHTAPLNSVEAGSAYAINVDMGGQTLPLIFDTGSSDLWAVTTKTECVGPRLHKQPDSYCMIGPMYSGGFQDGSIANENFNITYGDGEFVIGTLGYEDVTVAGVTVDHQEIALATESYFFYGNDTAGIIGFAYPALTSAFPGTNPAVDNQNDSLPYTDFIFAAIAQNKIAPYFSIVLERGANGGSGQVALGGLPTISFTHTFTSTPLEIIELQPVAIEARNYSFYTITPQGYKLTQSGFGALQPVDITTATHYPAIVDSGTTLVYLPNNLAEEINNAFNPPSVYIESEGVFENECDASPPTFAIDIGGTYFGINSQDLLLTGELGFDNSTGLCMTGIQAAGDGPSILGDVFLKNVVAVFDIGASEMKFAPHENY